MKLTTGYLLCVLRLITVRMLLQVNDYPFTTRGVTVGHIVDKEASTRYQVMDTPGTVLCCRFLGALVYVPCIHSTQNEPLVLWRRMSVVIPPEFFQELNACQ
jgi:hypothetical protein